MPLEELGMEYFDDPRGVPLAPPEKPLARKGVNVGRTSGSPKRILRGPKCRAIEAIRKANAEREVAQLAARAAELSAPAVVKVETQLPLGILSAQDSAIGDAGVVLALKAFQPEEASGLSLEDQKAEVLEKQAQEARLEHGCLEVAVFPNVAARSQEYFAAGMNNMEAMTVQDSDFNSWDFLLDPRFLAQDDSTRNSLDNFFGTSNDNGQTFTAVATTIPSGGQVGDMDFFGSGSGTAYWHGAPQSFNNALGRVPANGPGIGASSVGPRYNSTQIRAAPGTQMPRDNFSSAHNVAVNRIPNPSFQGHQGFNFNEQVSGTSNPQFFQAGQLPARPYEAPYQYVNPNWLQSSGQPSSSTTNTNTTNTTFSSSAGASSNIFQTSIPYMDENAEAAGIDFMTGSEWLDHFDRDISGGTDGFSF